MKKLTAIFMTFLLVFSLSACGSTVSENSQTESSVSSQPAVSNTGRSEHSGESRKADAEETDTNILVAYFSATGTTKPIAEEIAEILGADLYEIVPENPYTDDDLNYNDDSCRANIEQNDSTVRPGISNIDEINTEQYDTVLIGHPIWWGEEPRIMDTFMESVDLSGKTVVDFCTSGGSGISTATAHLQELSPNANWLEGHRFQSNASDTEINEWLESLNIK
jgi:flavodoxin